MTAVDSLHPQTLRAFLVTLYATGALSGEILQLATKDVDLRRGFITIRTTRFNRSRKLPIGKDLLGVLQRYAAWKKRTKLDSNVFFPRTDGGRIVARTMNGIFQRLRLRANIVRHAVKGGVKVDQCGGAKGSHLDTGKHVEECGGEGLWSLAEEACAPREARWVKWG